MRLNERLSLLIPGAALGAELPIDGGSVLLADGRSLAAAYSVIHKAHAIAGRPSQIVVALSTAGSQKCFVVYDVGSREQWEVMRDGVLRPSKLLKLNRQSLTSRAIQAAMVIASKDVPAFVGAERMHRCLHCPHVQLNDGKHYCGRCGCGTWQIAGIGSDLGYKTTKAEWRCPLSPPAYGPWTETSDGLTVV